MDKHHELIFFLRHADGTYHSERGGHVPTLKGARIFTWDEVQNSGKRGTVLWTEWNKDRGGHSKWVRFEINNPDGYTRVKDDDAERLLKLSIELCDRVDAEGEDVGTKARPTLTILREIGPLTDRMTDARS